MTIYLGVFFILVTLISIFGILGAKHRSPGAIKIFQFLLWGIVIIHIIFFVFVIIITKRVKKEVVDLCVSKSTENSNNNLNDVLTDCNNREIHKILKYSVLILSTFITINRLEITDKLTFPYYFKLLYRGSRDGATRDKFHKICNNQFCIVTIVKVKDRKEILGGYNPIEWKTDSGYSSTKNSFIFSFNSSITEDSILFSNNGRIDSYILSSDI
ncbi:hypothetical protein C1645_879839 [Glomus cerebriforme]|uniref:TLDc domain-containing protein n=1 Tax=Glomus cerebriforme TaxID=658196 RepID=A0A397SIV9_9GLOM|nr:hypothetical protein C1645_879839 [Glomus cerebriforme]